MQFQSHDECDTILLLVSIIYGLLVLFVLFIGCELGERGGNLFIDISIEVDQLDWYLLPLNIQKMLPIVIVNTKQSVVVRCFGSVACTRCQFKKVLSIKTNQISNIQSRIRIHSHIPFRFVLQVAYASYRYFTVLRKFFK